MTIRKIKAVFFLIADIMSYNFLFDFNVNNVESDCSIAPPP